MNKRRHTSIALTMKNKKNYEYELLYINKLDTLDKIAKLLERYTLPKLTEEEKENLNRIITKN